MKRFPAAWRAAVTFSEGAFWSCASLSEDGERARDRTGSPVKGEAMVTPSQMVFLGMGILDCVAR